MIFSCPLGGGTRVQTCIASVGVDLPKRAYPASGRTIRFVSSFELYLGRGKRGGRGCRIRLCVFSWHGGPIALPKQNAPRASVWIQSQDGQALDALSCCYNVNCAALFSPTLYNAPPSLARAMHRVGLPIGAGRLPGQQ